jgi:hypothetical protein
LFHVFTNPNGVAIDARRFDPLTLGFIGCGLLILLCVWGYVVGAIALIAFGAAILRNRIGRASGTAAIFNRLDAGVGRSLATQG